MSTCRSCGAEIEWAQTEPKLDRETGEVLKPARKIPLDVGDPPLDDEGNSTANVIVVGRVETEFGLTPVARVIGKGKGKRVSHFATCPNSKEHRRAAS